MTTARDVARYIVHFFQEAGDPVTNLKLQKLLYYVQGWHLALHDRPAFRGQFQAWVHGPVEPGVYQTYKAYRWNPIDEETSPPDLEPSVLRVIDEVLEVYGGDTGLQLERRTHREPPWLEARGGIPRDQDSKAVITNASMKVYFSSIAE